MRLQIIVAAAVALLAAPAGSQEEATGRPLRILLAASATPIPAKSRCGGALPGVLRVTLGALVASRLAVFEDGANTVTGACDAAGACHVTIAHSADEDVSSSEFRFRAKNGVLVPGSLLCRSTP